MRDRQDIECRYPSGSFSIGFSVLLQHFVLRQQYPEGLQVYADYREPVGYFEAVEDGGKKKEKREEISLAHEGRAFQEAVELALLFIWNFGKLYQVVLQAPTTRF